MGWDLSELYTQRRLRFLLNAIEHLPRTSHFRCAMAEDEDLAEATKDQEQKPPSAPPLTEWSPLVERMTIIIERLGELAAITASANSKRAVKPPKPLPRPVTAHERIRARNAREQRKRILEMVQPRPGKPTMADGPTGDTLHSLQRR